MYDKLNKLELSLTVGCKLDCDYCPQKLLLRRYYGENKSRTGKLSFENFKIVLEKLEQGALLSFSGMSEPFQNEECANMIAYAYERGYGISLNTTLVGMTFSDFEKIKNVQFKEFVLHIPDKEKHSKFIITDDYLKLLELVNKSINIKRYSCHGTVHEAVKDIIANEKFCEQTFSDRAGSLKTENVTKKNIYMNGRIACYHQDAKMAIKDTFHVMFPDGTLVLCCMDYGMKHVLGNLIQQSWSEIKNGDEYNKFRAGLDDESLDIICRRCYISKKIESLPAMQMKKAISAVKNGVDISNKFSSSALNIVNKFAKADNVCVFGLGKLWRDHFYQEYWNEGLGVTMFSDNNSDLYNSDINGIKCVNPASLVSYKNLLVVLFVKNGDSIISQLSTMGINNCILFEELLDKF